MDRFTTDAPSGNMENMLNLVYGKDGWQYIRHGDTDMLTTDFCLKMCADRGCTLPDSIESSNEEKDEWLCDCVFNSCPVATVYAALSGFGHTRARLASYEDTGLTPKGVKAAQAEADRLRSEIEYLCSANPENKKLLEQQREKQSPEKEHIQ